MFAKRTPHPPLMRAARARAVPLPPLGKAKILRCYRLRSTTRCARMHKFHQPKQVLGCHLRMTQEGFFVIRTDTSHILRKRADNVCSFFVLFTLFFILHRIKNLLIKVELSDVELLFLGVGNTYFLVGRCFCRSRSYLRFYLGKELGVIFKRLHSVFLALCESVALV